MAGQADRRRVNKAGFSAAPERCRAGNVGFSTERAAKDAPGEAKDPS
tara:strand:+ start:102 stop:242 length:141 start_codon:yes stop_codon:yes gene_type:complete